MEDKVSDPQVFNLELPRLNIQWISFFEFLTLLALTLALYWFFKNLRQFLYQNAFLSQKKRGDRILKSLSIAIPGFCFLYGVSVLSRGSILLNLGLFTIFLVLLGLSMAGPARSFFATLIFKIRGDVQEGDFIEIAEKKGKVSRIGPFNIELKTTMGDKILVPASQALQSSISIRKSGANPAMTFELQTKAPIETVESLTHLCPYKKDETDFSIVNQGESILVTMEVINREHRSEIQNYFSKNLNH